MYRDDDYIDPLGDDLYALMSRAQDRFRPPHERWRWVRRPVWQLTAAKACFYVAALLLIALAQQACP